MQWPRLPTVNMPGAAAVLVTLLAAAGPHLYISISLVQLQPSLPALRTHNYPTCSNILFGRSKISHLLHWLKAHMRVASIFHLKSSGKISMGRINRSKYKYLILHKCLSVAFAARCRCRPLFSLCTKPLITDKIQLQHESVTLLLRIVTICYNLP